jgi:hypothetical protein
VALSWRLLTNESAPQPNTVDARKAPRPSRSKPLAGSNPSLARRLHTSASLRAQPQTGVIPGIYLIYTFIQGEKILFTKTFVAKKRHHKYSLLTASAKKLTGKEVCMLYKKLQGWVVVKRHPAALSQCRVLIEP